jgi:hypothetical protein
MGIPPKGSTEHFFPNWDADSLKALARDFDEAHSAISAVLTPVNLQAFQAAEDAFDEVKRALPSSDDYWVDLWAFSTAPMPWGLGLTAEELWGLSPREWLARYRVWKYHRDDMHPTAGTSKCSPKRPPADNTVRRQRRGYRAEVQKWMRDHSIRTIPQAAQRLGVGFDTLKSIMSSKGEKRYSDDTLSDVLKKIGHSST